MPFLFFYIDGHHKLIRWRLVTHCGIDGYSRMVVCLRCSSNNRSLTVYSLFFEAVHQCGLPSRVRSDQGRENYRVAQHIIEHRGAERRSMITGSSIHNQRIERFWTDLHYSVTNLFYCLFYHMEYISTLDPANEEHLFALHYVFIPRINSALSHLRAGWNNHSNWNVIQYVSTWLYLHPGVSLIQLIWLVNLSNSKHKLIKFLKMNHQNSKQTQTQNIPL